MFAIRETQIKTTMRFVPLTQFRMAAIKKKCSKILGWCRENKSNTLFMGTETREATIKTSLEAPQKTKNRTRKWSSYSKHLRVYTQKILVVIAQGYLHICVGCHVVHTAKTQNQPRYPQAEMSRYRKRHAWTAEFCSVIKQKRGRKNEAGGLMRTGLCFGERAMLQA